jgi:hypothetical protein
MQKEGHEFASMMSGKIYDGDVHNDMQHIIICSFFAPQKVIFTTALLASYLLLLLLKFCTTDRISVVTPVSLSFPSKLKDRNLSKLIQNVCIIELRLYVSITPYLNKLMICVVVYRL